jgi:hypothetical protein
MLVARKRAKLSVFGSVFSRWKMAIGWLLRWECNCVRVTVEPVSSVYTWQSKVRYRNSLIKIIRTKTICLIMSLRFSVISVLGLQL